MISKSFDIFTYWMCKSLQDLSPLTSKSGLVLQSRVKQCSNQRENFPLQKKTPQFMWQPTRFVICRLERGCNDRSLFFLANSGCAVCAPSSQQLPTISSLSALKRWLLSYFGTSKRNSKVSSCFLWWKSHHAHKYPGKQISSLQCQQIETESESLYWSEKPYFQ